MKKKTVKLIDVVCPYCIHATEVFDRGIGRGFG